MSDFDETLKKIEARKITTLRLQVWDPPTKDLFYCCGNGTDTVIVGLNEKVPSRLPVNSKLAPDTVRKILSNSCEINGQELYTRVKKVFEAYLHFEDQRFYDLLTTWSIGTYLYSIFTHYGYLFFHSKSPRCGKTRALETMSHLAFEASDPVNAPTPPAIREMATDGGSLLLDTLERWKDKSTEAYSAVMELLDAGFRNGGKVAKMVQGAKGDWERKLFPVFAPYAMAGINKHSLSDTALDRSFIVPMFRKTKRTKKKKYNHFDCEEEAKPLRESLHIWALKNAKRVSDIYEGPELEESVDRLGLNDRATDIWGPQFAVLRGLGFSAESPEYLDLCSLAVEMHKDPELAELEKHLEIIEVLRSKAEKGKDKELVGMTTDFLNDLNTEGINITQQTLTKLLKDWGFEQKSIRLQGEPRRAWALSVETLEALEKELAEMFPSACPYASSSFSGAARSNQDEAPAGSNPGSETDKKTETSDVQSNTVAPNIWTAEEERSETLTLDLEFAEPPEKLAEPQELGDIFFPGCRMYRKSGPVVPSYTGDHTVQALSDECLTKADMVCEVRRIKRELDTFPGRFESYMARVKKYREKYRESLRKRNNGE